MTVTTAVPVPTFGPTGFIAPLESAILTGVLSDTNAAYGGNMNLALTTTQGQEGQSLTAIIGDANSTFLFYTQMVDPAYSEGRMQDALGRIYNLERIPASSTVVTGTCTGGAGVVIPIGALAQDTSGNVYAATGAGTIGVGGTVDIQFQAIPTGPIACPPDALSQIYQSIPGWDRVNNSAAGAAGQNVETRAAFELRRQDTLAANASTMIGAIIGKVARVAGVLDYAGYDNSSSSSASYGGMTIAANSICISVLGGASADVAAAILSKKGGGCAYTGNTTVTAYDSNPLYASPIAYSVTFERPTAVPVMMTVQIPSTSSVPSTATAQIQAAVANAFVGGDGGSRMRINSKTYALRYSSPIAALGAWAIPISITVGTQATATATFTAAISGSTMTTSATTGAIAIGQQVVGVGVLAGTYIVSGSGTSWGVSPSQTVGSEAMSSYNVSSSSVTIGLNQYPTLNPLNVVVEFV